MLLEILEDPEFGWCVVVSRHTTGEVVVSVKESATFEQALVAASVDVLIYCRTSETALAYIETELVDSISVVLGTRGLLAA